MPACQLLRLHPQRILTKIRQWTMGDKKKALISSKRKTLSKIMMTMTVVESYLADTCTQKHRHSSNCQPHLLSLCSCEMTNLESVILFPPTFKLPNCCPAVNTFPFLPEKKMASFTFIVIATPHETAMTSSSTWHTGTLVDIEEMVFLILSSWLFATTWRQTLFQKRLEAPRQKTAEKKTGLGNLTSECRWFCCTGCN